MKGFGEDRLWRSYLYMAVAVFAACALASGIAYVNWLYDPGPSADTWRLGTKVATFVASLQISGVVLFKMLSERKGRE